MFVRIFQKLFVYNNEFISEHIFFINKMVLQLCSAKSKFKKMNFSLQNC